MSDTQICEAVMPGVTTLMQDSYVPNFTYFTDSMKTGDIAMEKFENGIVASDLDSLLDMFEKAETTLSSSVGCISLTQNDVSPLPDRCSVQDLELSSSFGTSSCANVLPTVSAVGACNECNVTSDNYDATNCIYHESIDNRLTTSTDELLNSVFAADAFDSPEFPTQETENIGGTVSYNDKREDFSISESQKEGATCLKSAFDSAAATENMKCEPFGGHCSQAIDFLDSADSIPSPIQPNSSQKDDSETSSEWDDDFPSDNKWSDGSSSSPCSRPPYRGQGYTMGRREGPRRQQGRGRVKPVEEENLYDRLPSYYTVLSRPNRTATGLIRSSRSCLKMVLKSDLKNPESDPLAGVSDPGFDKVPAYQSCFTNSTRFDDESASCNANNPFDVEDNKCFGRGQGSGSNNLLSRPRFRSRSRLRTTNSTRFKRSGLDRDSTYDKLCNDNASPMITAKPESASAGQKSFKEFAQEKPKQQERRILYIGRIPANMTAERLRAQFRRFGDIDKCTVHFRECGDNYGFVTYARVSDAYKAVEGGNRLLGCANFDICFGGRRNFCRADYYDHDGNVEMEEDLAPVISKLKPKADFEDLLMDELLKRQLQKSENATMF